MFVSHVYAICPHRLECYCLATFYVSVSSCTYINNVSALHIFNTMPPCMQNIFPQTHNRFVPHICNGSVTSMFTVSFSKHIKTLCRVRE